MRDAGPAAPPPGGSRARRIGGLVAGLLIIAFLALSVATGWSSVSAYDWDLDVLTLVGAAVVLGVFLLMQGTGYVAILERVADRRLPRARLLGVWARSALARYVPGNVLMVAGRVVLGREAGITGRESLAASVYEHALLVGLSACAAIGLLLFGSDLGQDAWIWAVAVVPLGLLVLHPRLFAPLSRWVLSKAKRPPLDDFLSGREVLGFAGWYALTLAMLSVGVWLCVRGLVGPAAGGPLFVGAGFLLSFVVSMLAFVFPSGIGIREGIFALVLAHDLPTEVAIAAAAFVRLALTLVELAFTGIVVAAQRPARPSRPGPIVGRAAPED